MDAHPATLLHYLRRFARALPSAGALHEASDAALLGRFVADHDERAFAALVERHGPLVFQVCHRVLGDVHDTEDAFQAVFLVLARKAAMVRPREALPAWLHGVARRVALKARSQRARRNRAVELLDPGPPDTRPEPPAELAVRERLGIVDEELARLANVYRLPVMLCCLEGRSLDEAARQLGWTPGSVKGRLERGRVRLRDRLTRRGLTLSAALSAAAATRGAAVAAASRLSAAAVSAALSLGVRDGGVSAASAALAADTLRDMALARLRTLAGVVLATCLLATAIVVYRANGSGQETPPEAPPEAASVVLDEPLLPIKEAFKQPLPAFDPLDADAPVEVGGQVLDPDGKPCPGAKLYLGYSVRSFTRGFDVRQPAYAVRATSDENGRFRFSFTRAELNARWLDDSHPTVAAIAAGHGPGWVELNWKERTLPLNVRLSRAVPVEGRILDENRRPVADAKVVVVDVTRDSPEVAKQRLANVLNPNAWSSSTWRGPLPEQTDVVTDADGRFRLAGLGSDHVVRLGLEGPAVGNANFDVIARTVDAAARVYGAKFEHVAFPARTIRGVVRDQATGQPVPGVKVSAQWHRLTAVTDQDGTYELSGCVKAKEYFLFAQPPAGQPYFAGALRVADDAVQPWVQADMPLLRGIPIEGRVTDRATAKPPATAIVWYHPLRPNAHAAKLTTGAKTPSSAAIRPDGSFTLVVLPGPGAVCAAASPRYAYAMGTVDEGELAARFPEPIEREQDGHLCIAGPTQRMSLCVENCHALRLINPSEPTSPGFVDLAVTPARPLRGMVFGPDGEPLSGVRVIGASPLGDEILPSASFAVTGVGPAQTRDVVFQHPERSLGKLLSVRNGALEPLLVQLDSSASILGRVVNQRGQAVPDITVLLQPSDGGAEVRVQTDQGGGFRANVAAGTSYAVSILAPHGLVKRANAIATERGRSRHLGAIMLAD